MSKFTNIALSDRNSITGKKINFNDSITFEGVEFSYEKNSCATLKNINISIKKGGKYAIIGKSGSGKSTLGKLMTGSLKGYKGGIFLDGVEIKDVNPSSLIGLFGIISQNVFLMDDTIINNIDFYKNIHSQRIKSILMELELEHLSINNDIPIIILDEATSQLDNENMTKIENYVLNSEQTVISITHKLSSQILKRYDHIFFISEGVILEEGTYDELIKSKGGLYLLCQQS